MCLRQLKCHLLIFHRIRFFLWEFSLFLFLELKPVMITVTSDDDISVSRYLTTGNVPAGSATPRMKSDKTLLPKALTLLNSRLLRYLFLGGNLYSVV